MKDWVTLLTAIIQLITATLLLKDKKKGTKNAADHANVNRFPESEGCTPCSPPNHNINGLNDTISRRAYTGGKKEMARLAIVLWSFGGSNEIWVTEEELLDLEQSPSVSMIFFK